MMLLVMTVVVVVVVVALAVLVARSGSRSTKKGDGPFNIRIGESTCVAGQRGVFATASFAKGDVVERCPCVMVPSTLELGRLGDYAFDADDDTQGLAFGYGCMYNHSKRPNVEFEYDAKTNVKTYTATRDIAAGDELFSSYGPGWWKERAGRVEC